MTQSDLLKHLSNALFLAAVVVLVLAIVQGSAVLYAVAAFLFVDSFIMTSVKRRQFRQRKAAATR